MDAAGTLRCGLDAGPFYPGVCANRPDAKKDAARPTGQRSVDEACPMKTKPEGLRGFWSLIVTQFEGAFNDNALKTLVTFIGLNMALPQRQHQALVPLATALFSLPFILFSMAGGFLADRFSKRTVTVGVKLLEILIMAFATAGFFLQNLA